MYNKNRKNRLTFFDVSGIISECFRILYSVHIIAHLPFIGRRSNEGACVEQAPFALYVLFLNILLIFFYEFVSCMIMSNWISSPKYIKIFSFI